MLKMTVCKRSGLAKGRHLQPSLVWNTIGAVLRVARLSDSGIWRSLLRKTGRCGSGDPWVVPTGIIIVENCRLALRVARKPPLYGQVFA